jgi:hypothetical protein
MDPPRGWAHRGGDVLEESDNVVVRALLYLGYFRDGKPRPLPDFRGVCLGDQAQLGHRFASQRLDLEPDLELALIRPKFAHLRPGISIDHSRKIKARRETESVLYAKKRRSGGFDR